MVSWLMVFLIFQRWEPVSMQQRHGSSIVEVYRIVEEVPSKLYNLVWASISLFRSLEYINNILVIAIFSDCWSIFRSKDSYEVWRNE